MLMACLRRCTSQRGLGHMNLGEYFQTSKQLMCAFFFFARFYVSFSFRLAFKPTQMDLRIFTLFCVFLRFFAPFPFALQLTKMDLRFFFFFTFFNVFFSPVFHRHLSWTHASQSPPQIPPDWRDSQEAGWWSTRHFLNPKLRNLNCPRLNIAEQHLRRTSTP